MANFFFAGGEAGHSAINLDQIRAVKRDLTSGTVTIIFARDHTIDLGGIVAGQFMDVLTRLESEANAAWAAAKKDY